MQHSPVIDEENLARFEFDPQLVLWFPELVSEMSVCRIPALYDVVRNCVYHGTVVVVIPHHVDFVVPGVDAENWADADHVVDLGAKVLDELVFYGDT